MKKYSIRHDSIGYTESYVKICLLLFLWMEEGVGGWRRGIKAPPQSTYLYLSHFWTGVSSTLSLILIASRPVIGLVIEAVREGGLRRWRKITTAPLKYALHYVPVFLVTLASCKGVLMSSPIFGSNASSVVINLAVSLFHTLLNILWRLSRRSDTLDGSMVVPILSLASNQRIRSCKSGWW